MKTHKAQLLEPGDRVLVLKGHPWADHIGMLVAYETYGMGWKGWRVTLDEPYGHECYAAPSAVRLVKR